MPLLTGYLDRSIKGASHGTCGTGIARARGATSLSRSPRMEDGAPRPCLVVVRADNEPITLKELADGVLALAVAGRHAAPNGAGPRRGSGQHRACPSRCPVVSGRVHASDLVRPRYVPPRNKGSGHHDGSHAPREPYLLYYNVL
jgi:hypothetical protein